MARTGSPVIPRLLLSLFLLLILLVPAAAFPELATETDDEFNPEKFSGTEYFKAKAAGPMDDLDPLSWGKDIVIGEDISADMQKILAQIAKSIDWKTYASTKCGMAAKFDADVELNYMADTKLLRDTGKAVVDLFTIPLKVRTFGSNFAKYGAQKALQELYKDEAKDYVKKVPKAAAGKFVFAEIFFHDAWLWQRSPCSRYGETVWLKKEDKAYGYLKADCKCKEMSLAPNHGKIKVKSYVLTYEADVSTDKNGKVTGVGGVKYSLDADCNCDDNAGADDRFCGAPQEQEEEAGQEAVSEPEVNTHAARNARSALDFYDYNWSFKYKLRLYLNVYPEKSLAVSSGGFYTQKPDLPKCSEEVLDLVLNEFAEAITDVEYAIKEVETAQKHAAGNKGISQDERDLYDEYLEELKKLKTRLENDKKWAEDFWECVACIKQVSCDMEGLIEQRDELVVPAAIVDGFAHEQVNVMCGMYSIAKLETVIAEGGQSWMNIEVDDSQMRAYGIMFDEEGKLSEQIIDGGWDDPALEVYIDEGTLHEISDAEDPQGELADAWGETIKFRGTNDDAKVKAGLINLAEKIEDKLQESIKPVPTWKPPRLPKPTLPAPGSFGAIPLTISKSALKGLGVIKQPEPKPSWCTIRGIPYECFRNSLTLNPATVERGGQVEVKSKAGFFTGPVTLLLESYSGGSYGYTAMKVIGTTVNSQTYRINANIPSGQYKVSVIVEKGAIDAFSDASQTLTVHAPAPTKVPGKLGESCDNRGCVSGLVCGVQKVWGGGHYIIPGYGYTCIDVAQYNTLCVGRGNSPAPWHCVY